MELKDLISFTGIEADSLADFKSKFNAKFITRKEAAEEDEITGPALSKQLGKIGGTINNILKKEAQLTNDDLEGKKYEEAIALAFAKLKAEITSLKESGAKNADEKIKEYESKIEKLSISLSEEKEAKSLLKKSIEEKEASWLAKEKETKSSIILSAARDKVKSKLIDLSEEQEFFLSSKIKETFRIDFDEQGKEFIVGSDGKRIQNPNKAGDFLGVEDAILKIAEEKNYVKKNNGGPIQPAVFTTKETTPIQNNQQIPAKKVHPNAVKHAEEMKVVK